MKQVTVTDDVLAKLKTAIGDNVEPSNLAVFRAVALNTLPVRKKHPLYFGAVHPKSFLEQMATRVNGESLPLQVMHEQNVFAAEGGLPIGRIFHGEVVDRGHLSELQVMFWIDKTAAPKAVDLVNHGTVDQVSVSVLGKKAISNKSGFDFFGSDATFEHIWTGTDPDGNVMGKDGAHVIIQDLDDWFEMSLVGKGGALGARILPNGDGNMKLAATGQVVPVMTLNLSSTQLESPMSVDLSKLVEDLTTAKAAILTHTDAVAAKDAVIADLTAKLEAATAKVTELETAAKDAPTKADLDAAKSALSDVAKAVCAKLGDVDPKLPEAPAELGTFVKEKAASLTVATRSHALQADAGTGTQPASKPSNSAFRTNR